MIVSVYAFPYAQWSKGSCLLFFYINTSLEMTATFPNCAVIVAMSGDRGYVYLSIKHDRRTLHDIAAKERYIRFTNIVKKSKVLFKHYEDEQRIIKYEPWTQKRDKPTRPLEASKM